MLPYRAHEERNRDGLLRVRHCADWSGLDELGFGLGSVSCLGIRFVSTGILQEMEMVRDWLRDFAGFLEN